MAFVQFLFLQIKNILSSYVARHLLKITFTTNLGEIDSSLLIFHFIIIEIFTCDDPVRNSSISSNNFLILNHQPKIHEENILLGLMLYT